MLANPDDALSDAPPSGGLRRDCKRLARGGAVLCVGLAVLLLLDRCGLWLVARPSSSQVAATATDAIAPIAYLVGLWRLGRALDRFGDEGRLAIALSRGLTGVAIALILGGVFETLVAPGLKTVFGAGPGYYVGLNPAAISIAAVGVGLLAISRLLRRAASMEAELDGFL
jgi:hypothetical protein